MTLRLLRLMSQTLDHTHIGQALDISARGRRNLTLDDYYRLVREKPATDAGRAPCWAARLRQARRAPFSAPSNASAIPRAKPRFRMI